MIDIIDYGCANIRSVQNMLTRLGIASSTHRAPGGLVSAKRLILPGVGHFAYAMERLHEGGFIEPIRELSLRNRIPVLGICLGAQLLGQHSEEGDCAGLGLLPFRTIAFDRSRLAPHQKVPHMGWVETELDRTSPLSRAFVTTPRFYHVHSYHFSCDDPTIEIGHATYGYRFPNAVASGKVFGVQFHPEKSHRFGMQILKNFVELT
jgi:glutamine amidotransferase